jgi:phosphate transport system protein
MNSNALFKTSKIESQMSEAKESILKLLRLVEKQYLDLQIVINKPDPEEAFRIYNYDEIINDYSLKVTKKIIFIIAKINPFASDLRTLISYIHIAKDAERIGDYAKRFAYFLNHCQRNKIIIQEYNLCLDHGLKMLTGVLNAIGKNKLKLAIEASKYDELLNKQFHQATKIIISGLQKTKDKKEIEDYLASMQQLKYIERMGDHLVNICEAIAYINTGNFCNLGKLNNNSNLK